MNGCCDLSHPILRGRDTDGGAAIAICVLLGAISALSMMVHDGIIGVTSLSGDRL